MILALAGTAAFALVFPIFMFRPGIVITSVPYQVGREGD